MDLFNIDSWATSTSYVKNSIVTINNLFYYSLVDHTSGASFASDLALNKWGGYLTYNGENKPNFLWSPSYGYSFEIEPKVKTINFDDGYTQDIPNGINNILLPFNVNFDDRDLMEYRAILHFLQTRNGTERFFFILPMPFNIIKKFICPKWTPTQSFYGKYSIQTIFQERI